jgi:hypothetical protein
VRKAEYESLLRESEYAAWVAAFGFRVNHFTVNVNALTTFPDLLSLNAFLLDHGFTLNESGGAIKGTPADRLEQSSTRADEIEIECAFRPAITNSRGAIRCRAAKSFRASCPRAPTRSSSRPTFAAKRRSASRNSR